ncbi:MAG TPA: HepT-like ribonuclease domain-containing protein [Thermoanaerobaculia bacterium]
MRPEDRDAASLLDALEAAKRIITYVEGMSLEDYIASDLKRAAVERELTVIGEALNRLSQAARNANPNIAIPAIVGLRNRIIHEYEWIEDDRIFSIVKVQVPELIDLLVRLIPPIPPDPEPEE